MRNELSHTSDGRWGREIRAAEQKETIVTNEKDKALVQEIIEEVFGKSGQSPIYQTAGRLIAEVSEKFTAALTAARRETEEAAWTQALNMARVTAISTGMPELWALYEAMKRESEREANDGKNSGRAA